MPIACSVILSTYNAPSLLERSLAAFAAQDTKDFEIVIADDGSRPDTKAVIDRARQDWALSITHSWHEDHGFRKCRALNLAILASTTDYLIFSDGDCLPRPDFVHTHLALATKGRFLSGGYLKLTGQVSERLTIDDALQGRATSYTHLRSLGMPRSLRYAKRLSTSSFFARLSDRITTTAPTWNGHNASCWKDDALKVNGFDERMEWGGEDREFGMRLTNAGIKGLQVRFRTPCVHLDHARGYVNDHAQRVNAQIRDETRQSKSTRTAHGITEINRATGSILDADSSLSTVASEPFARHTSPQISTP
ncbi:MAG: glycosyltransferase family 2 protein [Phycisphaerales bacterium]|nr:MAG: glycosyltransferase family 2 protein [Phycisphaerales bacterium]